MGFVFRAIFILGALQRPQRRKHQNLTLNLPINIPLKATIILPAPTAFNMYQKLPPPLRHNKMDQLLRKPLMQLLQTGRHLHPKFGFNYEVMEYLDEGH